MKRWLFALMLLAGLAYGQDSTNVYPEVVIYSSIRPIAIQNSNNVFQDVTTLYGAKSIGFAVRFNAETVREINLKVQLKTNAAGTYRIELRNRDSSKVIPITLSGVVDTTAESGFISLTGSALDTFKLYAKCSNSTGDMFLYYAGFERRVRVVALAGGDLTDSIKVHRDEIDGLKTDSLQAHNVLLQARVKYTDTIHTVVTSTRLADSLDEVRAREGLISDSLRLADVAIAGHTVDIASVRDSVRELAEDVASIGTGYCNLTGTTIDWLICPHFKDTLAGSSITYTFTNVTAGKTIALRLVTDASRLNSALFDTIVVWPSGTTWPTTLYASSVYNLSFTAHTSGYIMGEVKGIYAVAIPVVAPPDTIAPDSTSGLMVTAVGPTELLASWPKIIDATRYTVKIANIPIAYHNATGTGGVSFTSGYLDFTLPYKDRTVNVAFSGDWTKTVLMGAEYQCTDALRQLKPNYSSLGIGFSGAGNIVVARFTYNDTNGVALSGRIYYRTYSSGVTVQHKDFTWGVSQTKDTVTFTAVTLANTVPTISSANSEADWDQRAAKMVWLASTTSAYCSTMVNTGTDRTFIQIIENTNWGVQSGVSYFTTTDDTMDVTVSGATQNKSELFFSYTFNAAAAWTQLGRRSIVGERTSDSTYRFYRLLATAGAGTIRYYIATYTDDTVVEDSLVTMSASETTLDVDWPQSFPLSNQVVSIGGNQRSMGATASTGTNNGWIAKVQVTLTDSNTTTITRPLHGSAAADFYLMHIGGAASTSDTVSFDSANAVVGNVDESVPGTSNLRITGLSSNTLYYVRMKAEDDSGNVSGMSNLASGTTLSVADTNAGDWFVDDSGDDAAAGTRAAPFKKISRAFEVARAGDSIIVRAGTYPDKITVSSGTSAGMKYLVGFAGETANITYGGYVIDERNQDYVSISNLTFTGSSIRLEGCGNFWITGCTFSAIPSWSAIYLKGSHDGRIIGNYIDRGDSPANTKGGNGDGISAVPDTGVHNSGWLIQNNEILNCYHVGISGDFTYSIIDNNVIHSVHSGIQTGSRGLPAYNVIQRNKVYNAALMSGGGWAASPADVGDIVRWNEFRLDTVNRTTGEHADGTLGITAWTRDGISNDCVDNTYIHNTIYGVVDSATENSTAVYFSQETGRTLSGNILKNNIIFRASKYAVGHYQSLLTLELTTNTFEGNLLRGKTANGEDIIRYTYYGGRDTMTLTETKANSKYDLLWLDSNIEGDPLFEDETNRDFILTSTSPARNAGTNLTVTTNTGTLGTLVNVACARYFSNGRGLIQGDLIKIGSTVPVRVKRVDYLTNQVEIEFARTWGVGDAVNYDYKGTAPDIGAYEYNE